MHKNIKYSKLIDSTYFRRYIIKSTKDERLAMLAIDYAYIRVLYLALLFFRRH